MIPKRFRSVLRMIMGGRVRASILAGLTFASSSCGGPDADLQEPEIGVVVVTQWNNSTDLFLEYPHPVAGQQTGNWAIHLSDMEDFRPIRSGRLTVTFRSEGDRVETFLVEAPARDGIFLLDPLVEEAGNYRVELSLASPQVNSLHVLPRVSVFSGLEEALAVEDAEDDGGIAFLKEQQWVIPFALKPVAEHDVQRTVPAPGEIVPPDGALVQVSALVDGIALANKNRNAPSVGEAVREGQILVVLAPTAQEGGFAQARGRVERLVREVQRSERLVEAGAIPRTRLEEARHDLEVARAELDAMGGGTDGDYSLSLRAPISGVVAERSFLPGSRVEAGEPLFTIVNPSTAWLRVQMSATTATSVPEEARATFRTGDSDQVFETSRRLSVGSVMNPETRTVPVVFEIGSGRGPFTFGQLAQATVPIGGVTNGIAVPNNAILDDNGTAVAYVQTGGETFLRRVLTLGARDGTRTQILAGLNLGERVVTVGAYQVRLASLSGGDFAGGHSH
jgi:cobalt-zinc-cadmium efflux system membrane fusion protein